jgi:hypothetical protein
MEIPKIPTDNLYKFKAISGIVIIIISLASITYNTINLFSELFELNYEWDIIQFEAKTLSHDINSIYDVVKQKSSNLPDSIQEQIFNGGTDVTSDSNSFSVLIWDYMLESNQIHDPSEIAIIKAVKLLTEKNIEIKRKGYELLYLEKKRQMSLIIFIAHSVITLLLLIWGGKLAIFGFHSWYYKLQKYQDKLIEKQSKGII